MKRHIEIMDTTLRDGEQTSGVSFSASEKLTAAQLLLEEVKVDRIEVASARVSDGELDAVKRITSWAAEKGLLEKVEVLTFVDGDASLNWMEEAGAITMNLLTKGSLNHLKHQLKKTPEEHFSQIEEIVHKAEAKGIGVNVYLEDWSNGMRHSLDYVFQHLDFTTKLPIKRILLPDTLGVLTPEESYDFLKTLVERYPDTHFDFHGHNDYDLGVANVMQAVKAGAHGIHLTVNGLGERAGNAALASAVAVLTDFVKDVTFNVDESTLYKISRIIEGYSGLRISANQPIVGESVFTQTAGIHADGDKKNNLYVSELKPGRFGRRTLYALGKSSGKANIEQNLKMLGISLPDEDLKKVTKRIIQLGDKKETVTREDLPFIIADVLDRAPAVENITVMNYVLTHSKGLQPSATLQLKINDKVYEENAQGDGQYDAFMNALQKVMTKEGLELPELIDYAVRIPPGGRTDALCETIITWKYKHQKKEMKTRGLDSDQTVSAIEATMKMLNLI
ncbi:alpha-isopropylmalate synthase regulatory domain-containing protein [Jiulongibacter sp. NS-SX5]|uniref:alpha-isopropylmalate synthase regulatory domain-containing protein n=1 Tax=Jiulongibacter sp. NS-SX5 TaxID=3463854 RepID=UPI004059AFC4